MFVRYTINSKSFYVDSKQMFHSIKYIQKKSFFFLGRGYWRVVSSDLLYFSDETRWSKFRYGSETSVYNLRNLCLLYTSLFQIIFNSAPQPLLIFIISYYPLSSTTKLCMPYIFHFNKANIICYISISLGDL